MSPTITITGWFVERSTRLIATPWTVVIGIILLLDRNFDAYLGPGALADAAFQQPGSVSACRLRSLESDTARAQYMAPATVDREPVVVGTAGV